MLSSVWRPSGKFVFWPAMKRGRRLFCISFWTGTNVRAWPTDWRTAKGNTGLSVSEKASVIPIRKKKSSHSLSHSLRGHSELFKLNWSRNRSYLWYWSGEATLHCKFHLWRSLSIPQTVLVAASAAYQVTKLRRTGSNLQSVQRSHRKRAAPMGSRGFSHSLWQPKITIKHIIVTLWPSSQNLLIELSGPKCILWFKTTHTSNHANMEQSRKSHWLLSRTVGRWVTSQERRRIISTVKFNSWVVASDRSLKKKNRKCSLLIQQCKPIKCRGRIKRR